MTIDTNTMRTLIEQVIREMAAEAQGGAQPAPAPVGAAVPAGGVFVAGQ